MTALVLVTGTLARDPETRTSRNGRSYGIASIRTKAEHGGFWSAFVFSESAREELMELRAGDPVAARGEAKFGIYKPQDGSEPRVDCSLNATLITSFKTMSRRERLVFDNKDDVGPRKPPPPPAAPAADAPGPALRQRGDGVDVFGDEVPF